MVLPAARGNGQREGHLIRPMNETSNVAIAAERYARENVIPNAAQDASYRPTTYERRLIARISVAFASGAAWASKPG